MKIKILEKLLNEQHLTLDDICYILDDENNPVVCETQEKSKQWKVGIPKMHAVAFIYDDKYILF